MAIEKMKFISACTDSGHLDEMLMTGIHSGMLHAEPASKIVNEDNQGKMLPDDNPYAGYRQTLQNFAHSLNYQIKEKEKSDKTYTTEEIEKFLNELNEKFGIEGDSDKVMLTPDDEQALAALSVCGFERIHACQYLDFGFGRLPRENFPKLSMYRDEIFVHHRLHENKQYIWMVYVTSDSYASKVKKIFDSLYFEPIEIPAVDVHKLLDQYAGQIDDVYTFCTEQNEIHELYPYVAVLDKKNILSGFVRADDVEAYEKKFAGQPVDFRVKEPEEVPDIQCPTSLKNNWFARPFELFLSMYGMPKYGDFDPTPFMAFTYCLLFGIMFGDMGQGIVLMLIGFGFAKKGKLFGIIGRCGITATIFGFLYGSVFGIEDLLNPVHQRLFGVKTKLIDVMANSSTMFLLIGAIVIGAVLILVTQAMNIANRLKHRQLGQALFSQNGVAGFIFYGSIIFAIFAQMVLKIKVLTPVYIIVFFILPVVCFVMIDPLTNLVEHRPVTPKEGWGGYITQSIFQLIDTLLTFVTNSMSYLRVGGFILSHAGMMLVVMTLVKMTGNAGPVVLVLGNIFVMVLEGLIEGIQTLRLEYYEMFSRYYDAGGIQFNAVTASEAA